MSGGQAHFVGEMRINKFLSAIGYCSRREADRHIEAGEVRVGGVVAGLGTVVRQGDMVSVGGVVVGTLDKVLLQKPVLIAANKPVGIVCTTGTKDRAPNIIEMVNYPSRIYPVGRLDKDSEGLLLLTNRGDIVNPILKASYAHEKEYLVRVDRPLTEKFVKCMRSGVRLPELNVTTRPCRLKINDKTSFTIILTQGLNRQIRRMCAALGYHVVSLKRVRIMNIRLGNLKPGTWRNVTHEEGLELERMVRATVPQDVPEGPDTGTDDGDGGGSGGGRSAGGRGDDASEGGMDGRENIDLYDIISLPEEEGPEDGLTVPPEVPETEQPEHGKQNSSAARERIVLEEVRKAEEKAAERRARSLTQFIRSQKKH